MPREPDHAATERREQRIALRLIWGLAALTLLVAGLVVLALVAGLPGLSEWAAAELEPGLGLRSAALVALVTTVVILIVFALVAGDGVVGELAFMLPGFFVFFVFFWLLIAWIF